MQKLKKIDLSTLGGDGQLQLLGEHACQTPCRELLIPLRGQGRGTRVNWTLLYFTQSSAERPQPTSGGCYPSGEKQKENEEDALLSELRDHLFLSKKWLLKK